MPPVRRYLPLPSILLVLATSISMAQEIPPQNMGTTGLLQELARLKTTARLMQSTSHPDDDDGSMLAYEARGEGATTVMLTLNRGEGGQNKVGSELFDELGTLRTLELLEAGRFYGVEQRFTRVVDFGFSKKASETFDRWGGHETALADIVRVIRQFRPDVIVSPFNGTPADGHGNHQASGILSREAFRAAADASRFPEQIAEGLVPWQAKKLYAATRGKDQDFTLRLDTGSYDPVMGMSYWQLSMEGLKHQASQGVGLFEVTAGPRFRSYKLEDSVMPQPMGKERGFFDGIDTTLPALASRLGAEAARAPFLRPSLEAIAGNVQEAAMGLDVRQPWRAAPALLQGLARTRELLRRIEAAKLSPAAKADLQAHLHTKEQQFERAANLALGTELTASVDSREKASPSDTSRQEQTFLSAAPGQKFTVTARFYNRGGRDVVLQEISLILPEGWKAERIKADYKRLGRNESGYAQFRISVPANARYTRPFWRRESRTQNVYQIAEPEYTTLALPPWPVAAHAVYSLPAMEAEAAGAAAEKRQDEEKGSISAVAEVKYVDPIYGQMQRPLTVGPPVSVEVEEPVQVVSTRNHAAIPVNVTVRNHVQGAANATVRLKPPAGWQVEPLTQSVALNSEGEFKAVHFELHPGDIREQSYELSATAERDGLSYAEDVVTIGRPDIGFFNYYRPARQVVSAVDVETPHNLRVGYIMGAGDDIPTALRQVGIAVSMITPDQLASGDLSQFDTIVIGIRAYDVRSDIRSHNARLMDFVQHGGTLLVQYNAATAAFNSGHYTPYPASLASNRGGEPNTVRESDRVTEEDAPVQLLAPQDAILRFPNQIKENDFQGWVQERGLYFMKEWDPRYTPLLASGDAGEPGLKGGLLAAKYGKGTYIFTGYAFFRQLPAGVPGAIRLFINLISAGHEPQAGATGLP